MKLSYRMLSSVARFFYERPLWAFLLLILSATQFWRMSGVEMIKLPIGERLWHFAIQMGCFFLALLSLVFSLMKVSFDAMEADYRQDNLKRDSDEGFD